MVPLKDMPVNSMFAGPNGVNITIVEKGENYALIEAIINDQIIKDKILLEGLVEPTWFPIVREEE